MSCSTDSLKSTRPRKRRIGVVGYGALGKYLVEKIIAQEDLDLIFVWNRTAEKAIADLGRDIVLQDLHLVHQRPVDLIVEVADPSITKTFGELFLSCADYLIGSPTAFADVDVEKTLRRKASDGQHGIYIPAGALWGAMDIQKMADRGTLKGLTVTMTKPPQSLKLCGELLEKNKLVTDSAVTLYSGPVRQLCPMAPNNVNTMAAAAIAGWNLGFDGVTGCLISDPNLGSWHKVEVDVVGPGVDDAQFTAKTTRMNPAPVGKVTGNATYASFFSSMLGACGRGNGVHLC